MREYLSIGDGAGNTNKGENNLKNRREAQDTHISGTTNSDIDL